MELLLEFQKLIFFERKIAQILQDNSLLSITHSVHITHVIDHFKALELTFLP